MKNRHLVRLLTAALMTLCLLTLTGCGARTEGDTSLQKVLDNRQLVLGLDVDFPPMGFTDESGEIVGFDIDVAQEVCDRLGVTLVWTA